MPTAATYSGHLALEKPRAPRALRSVSEVLLQGEADESGCVLDWVVCFIAKEVGFSEYGVRSFIRLLKVRWKLTEALYLSFDKSHQARQSFRPDLTKTIVGCLCISNSLFRKEQKTTSPARKKNYTTTLKAKKTLLELLPLSLTSAGFCKEEGCQPVLFSKRRMEECGIAWSREGSV